MISGTTRLAGLLGDPVEHSLSPVMHNSAMKHLDLDMRYMAFHVSPQKLETALQGMSSLGMIGTNVTVPHKEAAFRWVDELAPSAEMSGAVNTVIFGNHETTGHNTDIGGVKQALASLRTPSDKALVLGAGGAARGVLCALAESGLSTLYLSNRTISRAETLKKDLLRFMGSTSIEVVQRSELSGLKVDLLVNATSMGLEASPWLEADMEDLLSIVHGGKVLDMVYRREGKTDLVAGALKKGIPALGGEEVLLYQGVEAFELFTGVSAPVEIMREALRQGREIS